MRFWLCLVLTACGPGSPSAPTRVSPPSPSASARVVKSAAPDVATPAAPPPITAPHGGQITALAVTEDGSAVVSVDNNGRIRLWPSADGTREPVVIPGPAPHAVAIARDGDGFAIGVIDTAGGAHLIRASATGAVRGGRTLASEARATQLEATPGGLLFLRADQTLELVTPDGAHTAKLQPEPGTHIDSVVSRGRFTLALLAEDKQLRGQWIELAPRLGWGATTPVLDGKIAHAVLSPAGDRLAVTRPRGLRPALIDLTTGKAVPTPVCVSKGWPREEGLDLDASEMRSQGMLPVPLGFVDRSLVACAVLNNLAWWGTSDGAAVPNHAGSLTVNNEPSAVFDGGLLTPAGGNLAFSSPAQIRYLGYQIHDFGQMFAGPGGVIITGNTQAGLEIDGQLEPRARLDMSSRPAWDDAVPIDDRFTIGLSVDRSDNNKITLALYDDLAGITRQVLPYQAREGQLSYEPTTHLLAASDGGRSLLVRFDPVAHVFGPPIWLANGIMTSKLRVVDPRLSGGAAALELDTASDGATLVGEIFDADLAPGRAAAPRTSYKVAGELRAIDRAGRLYMRAEPSGKPIDPWAAAAGPVTPGDVIVYTHGKAGAHLTGAAALDVRPNADGSQIATYLSSKIALFAADGTPRWEAAPWSAKSIAWAPDGHLLVEFPSGLAAFDAATGAVTRRRCGWSFGVSAIPLDATLPGASICDGATL